MKDIKKELEERKIYPPNGFVNLIYRLISFFTVSKMNCEYKIIDDPKDCKGPCIIVQNHLSRFDHFFISTALYPMKFTYMVAYNEFYRSGQSLFLKLFRCIPKRNSVQDLGAIKKLIKYVKEGNKIVIAPEGFTSVDGQSHPVDPGTGHLIKHLGVPVYFAELRGQYLTATKTCTDTRNGKCYVTIKKIYTPEMLEKMSDEEVENDLNNKFRNDEYEWQKSKQIKWDGHDRMCKDLQDLCYRCPKCGTIFSMESNGNEIKCKHCGNGATMDEYYTFHPFKNSIIPESPSKWSEYERRQVIREIRLNPTFEYSEKVKLGALSNTHVIKGGKTSEIVGEGIFTINHKGVFYSGTKDGKEFNIELNYNEIHTVLGSEDYRYFFVYKKGEYYDIFPQERRSSFHIMLLVEEMHRLHVNTYKCLPWYNYMYKDLEK